MLALGYEPDPLDDDLVFGEIFAGKAWVARGAGVLVPEIGGAGDGAGEEAATEGAIGDEAYAKFADCREDLGFDVALPEGVLGLEGSDGVDGVGAADRGDGGFGEAEVADLSGMDEFGHGTYGVFDGGGGVDSVLVVEIDVVEVEALEGGVAGGFDVLRPAAEAPIAWVIFPAEVPELGGEEDLVAAGADGLADEFLVVAHAVDISGIKKVDTEIEGSEEGGYGLLVLALAVELAHAHAA